MNIKCKPWVKIELEISFIKMRPDLQCLHQEDSCLQDPYLRNVANFDAEPG